MSEPGLFSMGGYGLYVWASYALTLTAMIGEVLLLLRRSRTLRPGRRSAADEVTR